MAINPSHVRLDDDVSTLPFPTDARVSWVLLQPRSKHPVSRGGHHAITSDPNEVHSHLSRGGNVGRTGAGQATLDWDDEQKREALFDRLGPLPLHVRTGSGKHHTYLAADPTLPATIYLEGDVVGQVKRLPSEYVVSPPSIHPSGGRYEWLIASPFALAPLPDNWRSYLETADREANPSGVPGDPFEIPDAIRAGARHRTFFRWARSWKAQRFTLNEALEIILMANSRITHPPFPEGELRRYVTRCWNQTDREEFQR